MVWASLFEQRHFDVLVRNDRTGRLITFKDRLDKVDRKNTGTLFNKHGRVLCIVGFSDVDEKTKRIWMITGGVSISEALGMVRVMKLFFSDTEFDYECSVRKDFPEGEKLVKMLGFKRVGFLDNDSTLFRLRRK